MSLSALEKIAAIEAEAKTKIDALKSEAVSELVKRISAVKSELAALETEYADLTGKTLKGEKVGITRKRLSADEKAALVITVGEIIRGKPEGISMGDIVRSAGQSVSAVREAVAQVKGLKKTGNKASTLYFSK
jgi:hypothetical protein